MTTGTELSFKEKKKIILEIQNEAYAEADLELLRRLTPGYAFMHKVEKNPVKHHKEILTELVEKTNRDTIRLNRREYDEKNKTAGDSIGTISGTDKENGPSATNGGASQHENTGSTEHSQATDGTTTEKDNNSGGTTTGASNGKTQGDDSTVSLEGKEKVGGTEDANNESGDDGHERSESTGVTRPETSKQPATGNENSGSETSSSDEDLKKKA